MTRHTPQVTEPVDPMRAIVERVAAIRRYRGMTQDELASAMRDLGVPWQRVIVAKLESGRRSYLTVEELMTICLILEISPTDLLVPRELKDDQDYLVAPRATARAVDTREWVRGSGLLFWRPYPEPASDPSSPFVSPTGKISDPTQWMPHDRGEQVARRYQDIEEEETDQ
jgi:transcriptional regulator with XRE-family HTH domain